MGNGVTLAQAPPSNDLPPCLAFQRVRKHTLFTQGQDGRPTSGAHGFLTTGSAGRSLCAVPHTSGGTAGHSSHLYNTHNRAGHSVLSELQNRPPERNTSSVASRFPFRVFWTSSSQHGSRVGSSNVLCLTDRRGEKTVVQRLSKFWSVFRVFCDGFEQLSSFNLI